MTRNWIALAAGVASLMLTGWDGAQAQSKLNLRLDYSLYGTHAAFYLGVEKGLYKAEGIELTIAEGSGSGTTARLLAQGTDPVAFLDFGTMAKGVGAGMPIKAILGVHQRSPMMILSHAEAPVKSPKDLEGKVIAMSPAESTAQMFPVLLAAAGVDPNKVSVLAPATGAKTALFLQKRVDAITGVTYFHLPPMERDKVAVHYFTFGDHGVTALEGGVAANNEWLSANPELARRFVKATQSAFVQAKADPAAAVDALVKARPEQGRNRDLLLRQLQVSMEAVGTPNTTGMPFGRMSDKDWQTMVDQLLSSKQIPSAVPIEKLFSNDYVPN